MNGVKLKPTAAQIIMSCQACDALLHIISPLGQALSYGLAFSKIVSSAILLNIACIVTFYAGDFIMLQW